jgi:hypothetical protein
LPVLVAVAHQTGGDRVADGWVAYQDAAKVIAGLRTESLEQRTEVGLSHQDADAVHAVFSRLGLYL